MKLMVYFFIIGLTNVTYQFCTLQ